MAQATDLRAVRSLQVADVHLLLVSLAQMVQVKHLAVVPEVSASRQLAADHLAVVCLAQTAKGKHRLDVLPHQEAYAQVCLVGPVKPAALLHLQQDCHRPPAPDSHLRVPPHEWAAECSLDFRI
jgi:hypothetical protein